VKVAIVHDWLTVLGGAELVVRMLHELFPSAPIYVLAYNPGRMPDEFRRMDIRPSFVQKLPFAKTKYRSYLPLYPIAVEQFDLSEYDLVISSSHCCAHGAITRPDALHICYCYTPARYAWDLYHSYMSSLGGLGRLIAAPLLTFIRQWDYTSAQRVDKFVAISTAVRERIRKHYGRDAEVLHPPVDTARFKPAPQSEIGDYFFIMSRHVPYKRVDLAVEAFNMLGLPLHVAGEGPLTRKLQQVAAPNITFLGRVSDSDACKLMAHCKAFIAPQEEDFGLTAVEAQAAGRPVIAYGRGGSLDTVIDGVTGTFFHEQTPDALAEAVASFKPDRYDPQTLRRNAQRFTLANFKRRFRDLVLRNSGEHNRPETETIASLQPGV